jgi:2-haloacid dehalogenase
MLRRLKEMGMKTAILSNGSPAMLDAAVASAGLGGYLDAILSVERVGVFKPNSRVYDLVGQHFNCGPQEVLFVSANGWDAAGATGYGFETAWVNRNNIPLDRLAHTPKHKLNTLHSLPKLAQS